jgi:hypothetical protein
MTSGTFRDQPLRTVHSQPLSTAHSRAAPW